MPVLAYCITEPGPQIAVPETGVQGAAIKPLHESGLRCFVSQYTDEPARSGSQQVRETALVFSHILQDFFRQIAIIPFRFPTLLADETEVLGFLKGHAAQYHKELRRLRDSVQMEVQISFRPTEDDAGPHKTSGKDYLVARQERRQKLEAAAQEFRRAGGSRIQDWRQRDTPTGIRAYALVPREAVPAFLERAEKIALSGDLKARVTGPWPATEFLEEPDAKR
jgi:hypothetical protein